MTWSFQHSLECFTLTVMSNHEPVTAPCAGRFAMIDLPNVIVMVTLTERETLTSDYVILFYLLSNKKNDRNAFNFKGSQLATFRP